MRCAYAEPYDSPVAAAKPKQPRAPAKKLTDEEKAEKKKLAEEKKAITEKKKAWKATLVRWVDRDSLRHPKDTLVRFLHAFRRV